MLRHKKGIAFAALIILLLPSQFVVAQQVGSYVIVLEEARILAGSETVERVSRGMALKVRGSRPGGWLWVTRHQNGWIESKHVVPLQTALDYLAAEIAQQPRHAPFYNDRATVLFETGDYAGAVRNYSAALQLVPGSFSLHANRAVAYFELEDFARAVQDLNEVVRLRPDDAQSYIDRGWALFHARQFEAALADYQKALELDSNALGATVNLAWLRATAPAEQFRDGPEAFELALQACKFTENKDPFALGVLAAAQAEMGDFAAAVETQTKALEIAPYTRKKLYRDRLAFYTAGQPYRLGAATPAAKPAASGARPAGVSPVKKEPQPATAPTANKPEPKSVVTPQPKSILAPSNKPSEKKPAEVKPAEGEPPAPELNDKPADSQE